MQKLYINAGAIEDTYQLTVSDTNNADISTATFEMSFGGDDDNTPGTFAPATVIARPTPSTAVIAILVGAGGIDLPAGTYRVWYRVTLGGRVYPRKSPLKVQIVR